MTARSLVLLAVLVTGCGEVSLAALTVAPPGKTAHLEAEGNDLELSKGIAFAFECTANADGYYGPCRDAQATSDDTGVASVYASYLDGLAPSWDDGDAGPRGRTAFIVVGLGEGTTAIHVTTSDGDVDVDVNILPP